MNSFTRTVLASPPPTCQRLNAHPCQFGIRDGVIEMGGKKMGKITVRTKNGEEKDWVDWNRKMFEDIREGMFEGMCLDEMIQWVEQKLKERQ